MGLQAAIFLVDKNNWAYKIAGISILSRYLDIIGALVKGKILLGVLGTVYAFVKLK